MKYWKAPFAGLDYVLTWPSATSLVSVGQVAAIWVKAPLQPMALTLQESKLFSRVRKHPAANASGSDVFVCTRVFFLSRFHDLDVLLFLHVKCQHVATWCFRCLQFCHPRCWKNITYKALLRVCILFWSLAKPAQDTLLWAMQTGGGYHDDGDSDCSESSDGESRKAGGQVSWCIDGVQICRRAFQRMLGLGCGRLNRTRGRFQGMDERHLKVQDHGARAAESSASVNAFMYKMYYSVGESMPTGWLDSFLCCSILFVRFASEFCCHFCSDSVSYYKILFAHGYLILRLFSNSMNLGDEAAREKMMKELLNDALLGPSTRISKQLNPSKLSQRELPPGNWGQLFLVYQAYCLASNLECASRATFYNCTKSWRAALRFRPLSKHSLCHTCDLIKSKMRHAGDFMSHASATDELLAHLRQTWMCRQSYWHSRELSRSHQDVLCVIFDGFDKSKPVVPRWAHGHDRSIQYSSESIARTLLCPQF